MNLKAAIAFGATVSEDLPRPPALKISAAPYTDFFDVRQLESAIDPCAASPAGRRDRPVRMVVERNDRVCRVGMSRPQRAEMMEIAGTVDNERGEMRLNAAI